MGADDNTAPSAQPKRLAPARLSAPARRTSVLVAGILLVQTAAMLVFVTNIVVSVLGLPPIAWALHELIELAAALGLILGTVLGAIALYRTWRRAARAEERARLASGAFMDIVEENFVIWGLTPAERDVALFSIKGLTIPDIARLRSTSQGTVKAQLAAVYRKADVSGRPQLLGLFIEELMSGVLAERAAPH